MRFIVPLMMTDAAENYFLLDNKFEMHVFKSYVFAIVDMGREEWRPAMVFCDLKREKR
jgi:hypothetical protein